MPALVGLLGCFLLGCAGDKKPSSPHDAGVPAADSGTAKAGRGGDAGAPTGVAATGGKGAAGSGVAGAGRAGAGQGGAGAAAVGGSGGNAGAAGSSAVRPLLATSGAQLLVTGSRLGLQLTAASLADDADVFAVHQEFYGIPWAAFEADSAPPAEWSALLSELAGLAKAAQRPVFLSISMLNGARQRLAATTRIENGQVKTDDATTPPCYDFASASDRDSKREAYLRYLDYMLELFQPSYLNIAVEVNLFFEKCPAATPALKNVINAAYERAKAKRPGSVVFPSFQIDHLYGYSKDSCADQTKRDACFDAHYADIAGLSRDRFAISSYPFLNQIGAVSALPSDWFGRAAARGGERALIAETGWLSTPLVARTSVGCSTVFSYSESDSAAYLARVLSDAKRLNMDLVTWWSDRDLVTSELMTQCPCSFDPTWCSVLDLFRGPAVAGQPEAQFLNEVLLKAFGSMGLRHYDGSKRSAHAEIWAAAR